MSPGGDPIWIREPGTDNKVNVTSVTSNAFTFETVQGQHFLYPGTVQFSAPANGILENQ
jgi:hypothetical protein